jgi:dynein heavy chain
MGNVHIMVDDICDKYYKSMRRRRFVTPRSFLSFIGAYKDLYLSKYIALDDEAKSFKTGLLKIAEAAEEIKKLGIELEV